MKARKYKYQTATPVDWKKRKEVAGVVVGKATITINKRAVPAVQINTGKETVQVLGSARLAPAIAVCDIGDMIHIRYKGLIKGKGKRTMHDVEAEVWEGANARIAPRRSPKAETAKHEAKPAKRRKRR